jgi:hypothetical protein
MDVIELLGPRLAATFAAIFVLYLVWASAPIWWTAQRGLRRRSPLTRPWTFVATAATLCYGATALMALVVLPMHMLGRALDTMAYVDLLAVIAPLVWIATRHAGALPVILMLFHLLLTAFITHTLSARWNALCARIPPPSEGAHADAA